MIIDCPHCHRKLKVEDRLAGTTGQCPGCNKPIDIPKLEKKDDELVGGEAVLSAAGAALVKALNLKTLALFLVGVIIIAVVCVILVFIGVLSKNGEVAASMVLISIVIAVGLAGVLAGGVAFLTHAETRHQAVSFGEAVGFCMKRFLGLFGGTWTLILAVLVVAAAINGLVYLVMQIPFGPVIAALIYLPQFVINFLLVLAIMVGVLVPCGMAVDGSHIVGALRRLGACVVNQPRSLIVHTAVTAIFGTFILTVHGCSVLGALAVTSSTNSTGSGSFWEDLAPFSMKDLGLGGFGDDRSSKKDDSSLFGGSPTMGLQQRPIGSGRPAQPVGRGEASKPSEPATGNWLRQLFIGLILLGLVTFPLVYWIVSFTGYYERVRQKIGGGGGAT